MGWCPCPWLLPLRALRQPLREGGGARVGYELRERGSSGEGARLHDVREVQTQEVVQDGLIRTELIKGRWRDWARGAALAAVLLALMGLVLVGLADALLTSPSQRSWVVLGGLYYIGSTWQQAMEHLRLIFGRSTYLRVVVGRVDALMLFEAVTARLEAEAERRGPEFTSRDVEAFTKYDTATGVRSVKFHFWGTRPNHFTFVLRPSSGVQAHRAPTVVVEYNSGESVVMGRDAHLERKRVMTLWVRTSAEHVMQDKALLLRWFDECVGQHLEPPPDRVEVYGLQESSSDWVPEWQLERTKSLKSAGRVGDSFYLEREVFAELIADARIWARRALRLYMVTGPPGVGKTEFTVWLAGTLRMPIYRLSLTMDSLTDARLAQLLSQNMMKHETVVVQIDEFQEVLRRWDTGAGGIAVTPGGFCEVLQGSTTVAKGAIVLTGTADVASAARLAAYPALFRRFQLKIQLGYLEVGDATRFFKSFLQEFVDLSDKEWVIWQDRFGRCMMRCGPKLLSIDMAKQLLMRRITAACAEGLLALGAPDVGPGAAGSAGGGGHRVAEGCKEAFADRLFDGSAVEAFFRTYIGDAGVGPDSEEG